MSFNVVLLKDGLRRWCCDFVSLVRFARLIVDIEWRWHGEIALNHEEHQVHEEHEAIGSVVEGVARIIVDAGLKVHRTLGPGLLESAYEHCLAHELHLRGLACRRQVALPIIYEGTKLDGAYRLDMIVEESIVIEVKAVDTLMRLHDAQLLTYLKLSGYRLGFLMNFNVGLFKHGLKRMVL